MMEEMLARLDEKKARLDAARPLPPGVVAKLKEYFDVEWSITPMPLRAVP
jgi:hypothetical protein